MDADRHRISLEVLIRKERPRPTHHGGPGDHIAESLVGLEIGYVSIDSNLALEMLPAMPQRKLCHCSAPLCRVFLDPRSRRGHDANLILPPGDAIRPCTNPA